jgi:NADPH:quinone reductase-like Zn-dependent oxidoreductase
VAIEMGSTLNIRITVRGRLGSRLADAFDGLTLVPRGGATELVGEIADQTQLHGLLARVRDLGLDLESVHVLGTDPAPPSPRSTAMSTATPEHATIKRVIVDRFGGPEVVRVIDDEVPRPGRGEVRVRVLAAGVSFTDAQLRAGTYLPGAPKPPFTPGYELVGVVEELGKGCSRLRIGDRIGALTVWGADAESVCVPESGAVEVPEDLDPAEVLSLLFPYMTAYQVLHRTAKVKAGETVLVHGAAGRVGVAALELGAVAGLRMFGTASARDREKVEALGVVAIDYRNEDFLARVREEAGGVDVAVDSLGGPISLRSFRALRRGGRLVVFGRYDTLKDGHKDWPAVIKWYASIAGVWVWSKVSPRRHAASYHVQKYRDHATRRPGAVGGEPMDAAEFREDFGVLVQLLREGRLHPVVAERLPLAQARRAHELLESSASKGKLVLVP